MRANLRVYVVPHGGERARLPGDVVMLLDAVQKFLLHASREILPERERQSAQHEFSEEHEDHQAEILRTHVNTLTETPEAQPIVGGEKNIVHGY